MILEAEMHTSGEVTIERDGRQYGATYVVTNGMLEVKTHTETRSMAVGGHDPMILARAALVEIVAAQSRP